MADNRSKPDVILEKIQEEEIQESRGKLRIFFGAAPGVGKTYSMLEDALAKRKQGLDVVAGIVETHGRQETEKLLMSFERLPLQKVDYRGKTLFDFDLEAALKRAPALILVDEIAHTNAPGLKYHKRWQSIKELLDAGIDVYTTMNVQHIESLNDVVEQITGIHVTETVPDSIIETADSLELIDLPPEDLLRRLKEGKVYIPAQAEIASQNFFRKANLTALRELALRFTAEQVNAQVLYQRRDENISKTWPTVEKLLVCVGPHSSSMKLIRAAKRMASKMHAEWFAVYVEAPKLNLSEHERSQAIQNLRLAEKLGAETVTLTGTDLVTEIINFARERNVTKIVLGKRVHPRWKTFFRRSLVDELARNSGEIDIYIIHGAKGTDKAQPLLKTKQAFPLKLYLMSLGVVLWATFINTLLSPYLRISNLMMIYLLGVVIVALQGRFAPAMVASILSVLAFDFFFLPEQYTFAVKDIEYIVTLLIMLLIAYLISHLTVLANQQTTMTRRREKRTSALYALSRKLARSRGVNQILSIAMRQIAEIFDCQVLALLGDTNTLHMQAAYRMALVLTVKEFSIAEWVFQTGQIAGLGTETLSFADALFIPLLGSKGPVGVLKIKPKDPEKFLDPEQLHFLETCASQVALSLEVDRLNEQARKSQIEIDEEKGRTALLYLIAEKLQTPITIILKSLKQLIPQESLSEKMALNDIELETNRISRLVTNLSQITHLDQGSIKVKKELNSLLAVINEVLEKMALVLTHKICKTNIPIDLPKIPFDKDLIEIVMIHLLENAILYTPENTVIEISAMMTDDEVIVSVADNGPGLHIQEIEDVFEKFYQGHSSKNAGGIGLGLAICDRIIKAHGGKIWGENRPQGGAIFQFTLLLG